MSHDARQMMEFSDKPAVLILADGEGAGARARRSAELAGCRISGIVSMEDASARLARQAGTDLLLLELEDAGEDQAADLLDHVQQFASERAAGVVISAPFERLDLVFARASGPFVHYLCGADEFDRVSIIAAASTRHKRMLHDVGKEQGLPHLKELSQDVARIAATLATLAEREARAQRLVSQREEQSETAAPIDAGTVRAIIRARRLRDQYLGPDLFADPAWDILLDLFAARLEKRNVAVSSLCIAAAVPATTALRWIKTLTDMGLLMRAADPQDGRRVYIELSPSAAAGLAAYLNAAQRISPLIL